MAFHEEKGRWEDVQPSLSQLSLGSLRGWGGEMRGYLRSLGLGRGLVLRGVRAHGPDLEYCHTWVCAFTE